VDRGGVEKERSREMEGLRHMNLYPRLEPDANEEGTQDDSALMASDKKRVSPVSLRSAWE
jgi:hypothetical protein